MPAAVTGLPIAGRKRRTLGRLPGLGPHPGGPPRTTGAPAAPVGLLPARCAAGGTGRRGRGPGSRQGGPRRLVRPTRTGRRRGRVTGLDPVRARPGPGRSHPRPVVGTATARGPHGVGPLERGPPLRAESLGRLRCRGPPVLARHGPGEPPHTLPDRPPGTTYHLDGGHITDPPGFFCALGEAVNGPAGYFGWGLDALDDCLCGNWGAGPPLTLVWHDAAIARACLGSAPHAPHTPTFEEIPPCSPNGTPTSAWTDRPARHRTGPRRPPRRRTSTFSTTSGLSTARPDCQWHAAP